MKRADLIESNAFYIENFVQRVECRIPNFCYTIRGVWDKENFTKKEILNAYKIDKERLRDLCEDMLELVKA